MVAIAGGHGRIALRLAERLSGRGETVVCLIRNPDHAGDVRERGGQAVRKMTMDRDGAIKLLRAAEEVDAARYLMISSVGAEAPPDGDDVFSVYLRAKAEADAAVQASGRDWTIVRPGPLRDEPGTGKVRIEVDPFRGDVPRDDVAAVLDALLAGPRASGRILYVGAGETPIDQALDAVV